LVNGRANGDKDISQARQAKGISQKLDVRKEGVFVTKLGRSNIFQQFFSNFS
jgi:hypothetical protein